MKKLNIILITLISYLHINSQSFNFYDENSSYLRTITGLTGDKIKTKKGKKHGLVEQVKTTINYEFLDESEYIPDIDKTFIDTNISVKDMLKSGAKDFYVLVGNYANGIKQGEFKLLRFDKKSSFDEIASLQYVNDSIEGDFKFNKLYFSYKHKFNKSIGDEYIGDEYITVYMSKNKIKDQKIKISSKEDLYLIYKNNRLDSGCLPYSYSEFDKRKYYFKKYDNSEKIDITLGISDNDEAKTVLKISSDGGRYIRKLEKNRDHLFDFVEDLNCEGKIYKKDRYINFSIKNSLLTGLINCYYLNDSLSYSINTSSGQIEIWVDLEKDKHIKIPNIYYQNLYYHIKNEISHYEDVFLSEKVEFNTDNLKSGYFKIAEIKNITFSISPGNILCQNPLDFYFNWEIDKPFSIDYKIDDHIVRNESWQNNLFGKLEKSYVNFDINGNIYSSSNAEKNKKYKEEKEAQQSLLKAFGVKDENEVVSCAFCSKKIIKKNGMTIRSVECETTSIPCMNKFGSPCEWSFCDVNCSHKFQCAECSQYKSYRKNCY